MSMSSKSAGVRRSLLLSSMLVAALVAGGCTGGDSSEKDDAAKSKSDSSAEATRDPEVPSGDNGGLSDPVGARADLVDFDCASKGGEWAASGQLKNSSDEDATYLIRVTVHSTKEGTVFGSAEDAVDLKAGKKADIDFDDIYSGKEKKLDCTARVVRGS